MHGGFVMVADNNVTVAVGVAELAEEIDVPRAERALAAAEAAGGGGGVSAGEQERTLTEGEPPSGSPVAAELAAARAKVRLEAAGELTGHLGRT